MTAAEVASGSPPDCGAENDNPDWPMARWGRILDRVELRRTGLGLKFWGPPLWLEVTMTGPDSERWPANPEGNDSWNWLSTETCSEAERLLGQGADDDELVLAVGRYTVENLILNAVHEIGEWLRFDGERVFPAHLADQASPTVPDGQGNGSVQLTVTFASPPRPTPAFRAPQPVDDVVAQDQLRRLTELVRPSRFTYLPGIAVSYHADGPVIRLHRDGAPATAWQSAWSTATPDVLRNDADDEMLISAVQRDVHRSVITWEAERICRAFYIDHRRPWRLSGSEAPLGTTPDADDEEVDEILTLTIAYLDAEEIDA